LSNREPCSTGAIIWLTGLSGSGKTTLAQGAATQLRTLGIETAVVDGDVLRHGLCRDLGYSDNDRRENIRRAGEVAIAKAQTGFVTFVALISPFEDARAAVVRRAEQTSIPFGLVYVNATLATCERRDPKGLYRLARCGKLPAFTGISSPYEPPIAPDLELLTDVDPQLGSTEKLANFALSRLRVDSSFWTVI